MASHRRSVAPIDDVLKAKAWAKAIQSCIAYIAICYKPYFGLLQVRAVTVRQLFDVLKTRKDIGPGTELRRLKDEKKLV